MERVVKAVEPEFVRLETEPEPLPIDLRRTAVIVIDMTNAFVNKGGFFDLMGMDISRCQNIIEPVNRVINAARAKGCKIIHIAHHTKSAIENFMAKKLAWAAEFTRSS